MTTVYDDTSGSSAGDSRFGARKRRLNSEISSFLSQFSNMTSKQMRQRLSEIADSTPDSRVVQAKKREYMAAAGALYANKKFHEDYANDIASMNDASLSPAVRAAAANRVLEASQYNAPDGGSTTRKAVQSNPKYAVANSEAAKQAAQLAPSLQALADSQSGATFVDANAAALQQKVADLATGSAAARAAAKRRAAAAAVLRGGRASTMLTKGVAVPAIGLGVTDKATLG